ncbi:globin-like [Oratosquilla oratoria]|uniref:globin-like n=1 Tax=Oratosquilla oratoria TaxID=337810 RepID=UPI003F75CDCB
MGAVWSTLWQWWSGESNKVGATDLGPDADVPDATTGLTPRQKQAIRDTWSLVVPDMKTHGVNFFMALFQTHPHLQNRFRGFKGKTIEELRVNKRLVAHGSTVLMAVTSLVDNLDDVSVLVELLKTTGKNHKDRGVQKNDFELLAPVMIKFLKDSLGPHWSQQAEEAWKLALKVINSVIFSSYDAPDSDDEANT